MALGSGTRVVQALAGGLTLTRPARLGARTTGLVRLMAGCPAIHRYLHSAETVPCPTRNRNRLWVVDLHLA